VEVYSALDGVWTQHVPGASAAWLRRTDELPSVFPVDPRKCGTDDIRRSILDVLHEDQLLSVVMGAENGANIVRVAARSAVGAETTYEFSSKVGYLPVRLVTRWPNGSINQLVEFEYRQVLDGSAWFLERLVRRFFDEGVTRVAATTGWRQQMVREMVSDVRFPPAIDRSVFELKLPIGTRVSDATRQAVYGIHEPLSTRSLVVFWANCGLIAALVLALAIRRRRLRPMPVVVS
jgi:hypothetical protein